MWPNEKAAQQDPAQGPLPNAKDTGKDPLPSYSTNTTLASSSTTFQTRFASLSMHMEDRIRLLRFPPPIIELCRQAIKVTWARGIQDEREYGGSHEFKLYGTPWRGYGDQAIAARRLIRGLLAALHNQGWVLMLSTDVSKKNYDKDSLLFRHQTPAPAECDWCCIGFSKSDRIRFIDAPSEVYTGFIPRLERGRLQDQGQHAPGVYELKLYGKPWWADGTDTMMVRGLLLGLLESLEEEGWTVYASIDQKNGGEKFTETDTEIPRPNFHKAGTQLRITPPLILCITFCPEVALPRTSLLSMSWFPSILLRPRAGTLIVLGGSALGGAAYRYSKPTTSSDTSLNPHTFTPYTLVEKQAVSSTSAIFTLRSRNGAPDPESVKEGWKRSVWSVQIKQPQLQIARAYTPLPPVEAIHKGERENPEDIRLLIRQEEGGEVSTYLHRLPEQSMVEIRGPNIECELPHDIREVIFLAGGTGIAPAMQVTQAMARRTDSKMHLLWANRRREECIGGISDDLEHSKVVQNQSSWWRSLLGLNPPAAQQAIVESTRSQGKGLIVQELDALKERSRAHTKGLEVDYYVDEEKVFIKPGDVAKRLGLDSPAEKGSKVILVSGPEGFIEHWAGKKVWIRGREVQGPLGGVLGRMDLKGWKVFKL